MKLLLSSEKLVFSLSSISHKYWLLSSTSSSPPSSASNKCRFLSSSSLSSSSSSTDKCEHFFPSFYNGYVSHRIEWYYSVEPPHPPHRDLFDEALKKVFNKNRMSFPDLGKVDCCRFDYRKKNNGEEPIHWDVQHRVVARQSVDVVSLLSAHGDELVRIGAHSSNADFVKAENLRGKHVLLCCAFIPLLWIDKDASYWRQLSLLHSELSQTHIGSNFEIVIVVNMREKWEDDEIVFNHFYSAFPGCLAVPFTHKYRRDYICKCLSNFSGKSSFILVDPSQNGLLGSNYNLEYMVQYGIRGFPFTNERRSSLHDEDDRGRGFNRPPPPCNLTLEGLLSCKSNPASSLVCKFNSEETISVEQLNKNHVGLYLFREGDKLKQIHDIYQQCKDNGLDFEIVLVPLPYTYSIHPKDFHDVVHNAINKFQIPNWWFLPFNNSVYLRLYNLSGLYNDDVMIIVGPHNEFVDRYGGKNIYKFSSYFGTQAYPFTDVALLHTFLRRLENLTLESFLSYDYVYQDYECDKSKMIPVSELKGKNVLVYMDNPLCLEPPWTQYEQVVLMFNKIKKVDPDFEMVFAPVLFSVPESEYSKLYSTAKQCIFESKMKWFIRPFEDPKHSEIVRSQDAFVAFEVSSSIPSSVLAFGKDGRILSLDAIRLYWSHGLDPFSSLPESMSQTLSDEIRRRFLVR